MEFIDYGTGKKKFLVEWSMLPALSEEFANKMASVSDFGMENFREVELDFLAFYPQAIEEDKSLSSLNGLQGGALETAINDRLCKTFTTRPSDLSEQWCSMIADAFYYFVTIREASTNKLQGFVTFQKKLNSPLRV